MFGTTDNVGTINDGTVSEITNVGPLGSLLGPDLWQVGNNYAVGSALASAVLLQLGGVPVTAGASTAPFAAAALPGGGYEVAWRLAGASTMYTVWDITAAGNYAGGPIGPAWVPGTSFALQQLETSFNDDLNGDGTIGPVGTVLGPDLWQVGNNYAVGSTLASAVLLQLGGVPVTAGASAVPFAAATLPGGGYEVAWRLAGASTMYTVWDITAAGNYASGPTGPAWVPGTSFALQQLETSFNDDLNGDGTIGPVGTVLGPDLWQVGNNYAVGSTLASAVLLQLGGVPVTAGASAVPFAAATLPGGGYEVAWRLAGASTMYTVWDITAAGNYTSGTTGPAWVPGTSFALQQLETSFNDDLNGDGTIGPVGTVLGSDLWQVGNNYVVGSTLASAVLLQLGGVPITIGANAAPYAAAALPGGGYEVAWRLTAATALYTVWDTIASGNYVSSPSGPGWVPGTAFALQQLETSFNDDLNGDGTIGPIDSLTPSATLTVLAPFVAGTSGYGPAAPLALDGSGNLLGTTIGGTVFEIPKVFGGYANAPVTLASVAYAPAGGLLEDSNGNLFDAIVSGSNNDGEVFELLNQGGGQFTRTDLATFDNANGKFPESALIADEAGSLLGTTNAGGYFDDGVVYELAKSGTGYQITDLAVFSGGDGASPRGGLIADTVGNLFGTTFAGGASNAGVIFELDRTAVGYATNTTLVSFNGTDGANPDAPLIMDSAGNLFGTTTKGGLFDDGTVFELIRTANGYASTPTVLVNFDGTNGANPEGSLLLDATGNLLGTTFGGGANGDGTVFELTKSTGTYASTPNTLHSFAGSDGANPLAGLIADSNGNLFGTTSAGGLNGDGTAFELTFLPLSLGPDIWQVGNNYVVGSTLASAVLLQMGGVPVTVGASATPYAAATPPGGGYEVAWRLAAASTLYTVWNTTAGGNYVSSPSGPGWVPSTSFALQQLETSFNDDLNGDGRLSTVLATSAPGGTLDLTAQTQNTTISLGPNVASVSFGLNAPSLSFIGSPDAILLGGSQDTIEYKLEPASGIETVSNFTFGLDELNIDLMGAANSSLQAFATTAMGAHAIAIANDADLTHGIVLLNIPSTETAADLLTSHVSFVGGHALIG